MSQKLLVVDDDLEILQMLYDALSDEAILFIELKIVAKLSSN